MPAAFTPKVVTGNHLMDGDVIYLTLDDSWTRDLAQAEILDDEAHADLRLIDAAARVHEIVGAYLTDVEPTANGPRPVHFREDFRATGPSNYFHGKQQASKASSEQEHV